MVKIMFEYENSKSKLYTYTNDVKEEINPQRLVFRLGTQKAVAVKELYERFNKNMNAIYNDPWKKDKDISAKLTLEINP